MDSSETRSIAVSGNHELPIDLNSSGKELDKEIVNQYGQLLGEYSKLDDELWLTAPDDNKEAMAFCGEGLDWSIVPSHPHEHIADMQLSEYADNSLTNGGITSMENNSSSFNESSHNQCLTFSPISVLHQRRSFSNKTPFVMKRARTKHRHPSKKCFRFVLDETTDSCPNSLVRTRKMSDLLQLNSSEKSPNPNPILETTQLTKKCVHCDSVKTPQWRDGPLGRKTLCNACGLQYKKALGFDYYRPLRILKPQIQVVKKCMHCESIDTPQWRNGPLGRKTLCNACGIQYKKGLLSPDYRPIRTPRFYPYQNNVQEMIMAENSEIDCNCARKEKTIRDMAGDTSDMVDSDSDPDFKPSPRRKLKPLKVEDKKCAHCESTKTPQWRTGPLGRKTLCNACGVQYRKGLLSPDYRPIRTPRFDPNQKKAQGLVLGLMAGNSEMNFNCARKEKIMQDMTREPSDMLVSDPHPNSDPDFKSILRRKFKLPNVEGKKCAHCESTKTPQWREGPLGRKTLCNACGVQYKKRLLSPDYRPIRTPRFDPNQKKVQGFVMGLMAGNSEIDLNCARKWTTTHPNPDPVSKPIPRRKYKLPNVEDKKCAHCESTKTPQWREGPLGHKTLCNACGVQYRNGRLFPEYRPLLSPTYDPSLHSHVPKRVDQMRLRKLSEEGEASVNIEQPA